MAVAGHGAGHEVHEPDPPQSHGDQQQQHHRQQQHHPHHQQLNELTLFMSGSSLETSRSSGRRRQLPLEDEQHRQESRGKR